MEKNNLINTITGLIQNPLIRQMLTAVEKNAKAAAKAEFLSSVVNHQERALANGILTPLPEDYLIGMTADKMKAEAEVRAAQKEALKAIALLEVERHSIEAGAINPSLVGLALSEAVDVNLDKNGEAVFKINDKATGKPKYNPRTGTPYSLTDYICEMKQSEEHGFLFTEGQQAGASGQSNPWSKQGFNLTQQAQILRTDPAKAARMKAEAGQR